MWDKQKQSEITLLLLNVGFNKPLLNCIGRVVLVSNETNTDVHMYT